MLGTRTQFICAIILKALFSKLLGALVEKRAFEHSYHNDLTILNFHFQNDTYFWLNETTVSEHIERKKDSLPSINNHGIWENTGAHADS